MRKVQMIQLFDGSLHDSANSAERRLSNILASGVCLEVFEALANKNTMKIQQIFVENEAKILQTMQVVRELKEVLELKK